MSPISERTLPLPRGELPAGPAGPVLVLGHTGLLGQALMRVADKRGLRPLGISRRTVPGLNLARQSNLAPFLDRLEPSLIVNAAALSDLAACEADASAAHEVNARLPGLLAEWARRRRTPWVQVSTDHYWCDIENVRHDEGAPLSPPNTYARSKRGGEEQARKDPGCLVLRTSIVGFRGRAGAPTFVEAVLAALAAGRRFDTYIDVWASSIEVHQFAEALFDLTAMGATGLLNLANSESVSQADFVAALAVAGGYDKAQARRVPRPHRRRPRRANATGLNVARAEALLGRALPTLAEVIDAIVASPGMPRPAVQIAPAAGVDVELDLAA